MNSDRIWTLLARKLTAEASVEELKELEELLRQNPEVHVPVQTVTQTWELQHKTDIHTTEQAYERLTHNLHALGFGFSGEQDNDQTVKLNPVIGVNKKRRYFQYVATFLIVVAGGTVIWQLVKGVKPFAIENVSHSTVKNRITTKYGSRTKVELPDGSTVWLNSGSTLTYDKQFGDSTREVRLSGEGYFNVIHKDDKPFIIHTSFIDIKDLGTQFNVKCYPDDKITETSLVEGSVEIMVKKRGEKYTLKPNQKLVLLNEAFTDDSSKQALKMSKIVYDEPIMTIKSLTYKPDDSVAVETAWAYNKLSFADEPFSEVTKKLSRWFNRDFEFRDKKLENERLTGTFPTQTTLEQAMEALKYGYRFNYELKDDKVIIY